MEQEKSEIVTQIWDESRNRLKGFINKRVSNESDAEDVLQNVFIKIQQNISDLKDAAKLYPWIFQTTRNAIIDYYRERETVISLSNDFAGETIFEPSEKDVEEEVLRWLEPMVGRLPEKYREALMLSDIQGLTQKEMSEKLDISLSGAKSRVQRGREKLKKVLLECCRLEFNRAGRIVEYKPQNGSCRTCAH